MEKDVGKEILPITVISIKENIKMIKNVGLELLFGKLEINIQVNILMI